jgi:hypothetical protein
VRALSTGAAHPTMTERLRERRDTRDFLTPPRRLIAITWLSTVERGWGLKQPGSVLPARTAVMARLGRHSRAGARATGDFVLARAAGSTGRPATLLVLTIAPPAFTKIDLPSNRRAIGEHRRVTDRSRARPAAGPRLGQAAAAKAATALAASGFSSSTRWPAPLKISTFAFGSAFFQSSACWGGTSLSSSPHTMRVGTSMRWR